MILVVSLDRHSISVLPRTAVDIVILHSFLARIHFMRSGFRTLYAVHSNRCRRICVCWRIGMFAVLFSDANGVGHLSLKSMYFALYAGFLIYSTSAL
ncbi:hypothetical protein B0H13DRAFT_794130 [Mycena leptocephala]|nr:hypothetical protein B0H13DRAFT_794130 [Mycena leptocephala]